MSPKTERNKLPALQSLPKLPSSPQSLFAGLKRLKSPIEKPEDPEALRIELRAVENQLNERLVPSEKYRRSRPPPPSDENLQPFNRSVKRHENYQLRALEAREAATAADRAVQALREMSEREVHRKARDSARKAFSAVDAEIASAAMAAAQAAQTALAERTACRETQQRNELARKFLRRQVTVECPICGDLIAASLLRKHRDNECRNRLVPCKNAASHCCPVMVRPLNRAWHENVDHLLAPRTCLSWPGPFASRRCQTAPVTTTQKTSTASSSGSPYVAIDEEDVNAPWTTEYWLWRPPAAIALSANAQATLQHHSKWRALANEAENVENAMKSKEEEAVVALKGTGPVALSAEETTEKAENRLGEEIIRLNEKHGELRVSASVERERCCEFARATNRLLETVKSESGKEAVDKALEFLPDVEMLQAAIAESIQPVAQKALEKGGFLSEVTEKRGRSEKGKRARLRARRKAKFKLKVQRTREAQHGVSVEDRAMLLTTGSECRDAIAASSRCRILLATDVDGKKLLATETIGIAFPGIGTFALGAGPLPREKWVHVALVASEQRTLKVYVDGELVNSAGTAAPFFSLPKGVEELPLPMRDLGSDRYFVDGGFHGLMLEARYWATARTTKELRQYSHSLPSEDARAHGMIGWWTCEEGESKWLHDRSECRYRSAIKELGLSNDASDKVRWTNVPVDQEPPTPASREHGVCQIELHRVRLAAKGRELYQVVGCRNQGCLERVMRCQMRFHVEYACAYRPASCPYCGISVPHCELQLHQRDPSCPAYVERTRLAKLGAVASELTACDLGCEVKVRRAEMDRHCKFDCAMRLVPCPQQCGISIPFGRLALHTRYFCGNPIYVAARKMAQQFRNDKVSVIILKAAISPCMHRDIVVRGLN